MIAKCDYCGIEFNAQRKTARFCTDLHRTLFGKLSEAEKLEKLNLPQKPVFDAEKLKARLEALEWVKEVEVYCNETGITPQELIEYHKGGGILSNKAPKVYNSSKNNKPVEDEPPKWQESEKKPFMSEAIRKKLGL